MFLTDASVSVKSCVGVFLLVAEVRNNLLFVPEGGVNIFFPL